MSRVQHAVENHNIRIRNEFCDIVEQFKYLGTTPTNQNCMHEEIKSRLKSRNDCYHLVLNFMFSSLFSKNIKIKINITIILPLVLYGCEAWYLYCSPDITRVMKSKRMIWSGHVACMGEREDGEI
jgi:hypothetical protein